MADIACDSIDIIYTADRKYYVTIPYCLITKIFTSTPLTALEKIFYFIADQYAHINESAAGLREIEKSGLEWANLLGCSEEWVFQIQKSLENKGYFSIIREKDEDNQNEKNIIIPTLPDDVFDELAKIPNRFGKEYLIFVENNHAGCKRSYLDDSKLFIPFNLQMLKLLLIDSSLSALQKLIWLHFYCRSHISYTDSDGEGTRKFITTYQEIATFFECKENTVSIAVNKLAEHGYISKKQFRTKAEKKASRRKKKSCWEIEALFPQNQLDIILQQPDRQNLPPLTADDLRLYNLASTSTDPHADLGKSFYYHDRSADPHETSQYYNKYNISNINKNTDQSFLNLNNKDECNTNNNHPAELLATTAEIAEGIKIMEDFNSKTLELANSLPYEQALLEADSTLSNSQHWLVTKAAFSLQVKYQNSVDKKFVNAVNNLALPDENANQYSESEKLLMEMWDWFAAEPSLKNPEFLLRKSWLLPLLQNSIIVEPRKTESDESIKQNFNASTNIPILPGDKTDKASKFALAIRNRNLAKGYAAEVSQDELVQQFIYHAANWIPERLNCKTREEQVDAALSFAWRAAANGTWRCPYGKLNDEIYQREAEARNWKKWR